MALIYISVFAHAAPDECKANLEFAGEAWMDALDAAYAWLRANREEDHSYHIWA